MIRFEEDLGGFVIDSFILSAKLFLLLADIIPLRPFSEKSKSLALAATQTTSSNISSVS